MKARLREHPAAGRMASPMCGAAVRSTSDTWITASALDVGSLRGGVRQGSPKLYQEIALRIKWLLQKVTAPACRSRRQGGTRCRSAALGQGVGAAPLLRRIQNLIARRLRHRRNGPHPPVEAGQVAPLLAQQLPECRDPIRVDADRGEARI